MYEKQRWLNVICEGQLSLLIAFSSRLLPIYRRWRRTGRLSLSLSDRAKFKYIKARRDRQSERETEMKGDKPH